MPKRSETVSLAPPPADPAALEGFPRMVLESVTCLYRVGRAERSPWWFGSSLEGRFDLPEPDGTCYVALDPLAALLEVIGPDRERGYLSAEHLARRRIYELYLEDDRVLADLPATQAAAFGVTLEIHAIVPYDLPQTWAHRLRAAGFEGVRYLVRHDPSGEDGLALFGSHGGHPDWPVDEEREIGAQMLERLETRYGLKVLRIPHSSQIEVVGS